MKNIVFIATIVLTMLFVSCGNGPDLIVDSITINPNWAAGTHTVDVKIKNVGNKDAVDFLLYVEAHNSNTNSDQISSQSSKTYQNLPKGAIDVFAVNFDTNPFVAGHTIADVIKIHAVVDAKLTVEESNETNNENTVNVP